MDDQGTAIIVGAFSIVSGALGVVGKIAMDRLRNGNGNGNGKLNRDEIVFQTTMEIAVEQITKVMGETVLVMREIHGEIKAHRETAMPAVIAGLDTHRLVTELHARLLAPVAKYTSK